MSKETPPNMSFQIPPPAFISVTQPSPSNLINLTSSLSLSFPYRCTLSSRIENLVEISTLLEGAQLEESLLPLLSRYNVY